MIKAVFDTNTLVSGITGFLIPQSTPGQLLRLWRAGRLKLIISDHLLNEVSSTLQKPYFQDRLTAEQRANFQLLLAEEATLVPLTVKIAGVATHSEDDLVIATAVSGQADYLVTGDGPLIRKVPTYQGVALVSPRLFLEIMASERSHD